MLSYAVCGTDGYAALANGLQFTLSSTQLYAHVCRGSSYADYPRMADPDIVARAPWPGSRGPRQRASLLAEGRRTHGTSLNQSGSSRLHVNPRQLEMRKGTPAVLAAHLSNLAYCENTVGHACKADAKGQTRFVLMAGNAVLFRPGLEAWVGRHTLSFCTFSGECTDSVIALDANPCSPIAC